MIGEDLAKVISCDDPNRANEAYAQISESRIGRCIRTPDYMYSGYAPGVYGGAQVIGKPVDVDATFDFAFAIIVECPAIGAHRGGPGALFVADPKLTFNRVSSLFGGLNINRRASAGIQEASDGIGDGNQL